MSCQQNVLKDSHILFSLEAVIRSDMRMMEYEIKRTVKTCHRTRGRNEVAFARFCYK